MLIDEFEDATNEAKTALISVLNFGFQRAGVVPRCVGKDHEIRHFQAYGPKAFAGLTRIPDALKTRSIPILMVPKAAGETIQPFHPSEMGKELCEWRDNAAIFALENARDLEAAALDRAQLGIPAFLHDREVDCMTPLFALAKVSHSDVDALRAFCTTLANTRRQRAAEGQATKAVEALMKSFPKGEMETKIFLSDAASLFCKYDAFLEEDERSAGELLRNMGLEVKQVRIGNESKKGLVLSREKLENLAATYLPSSDEDSIPQPRAA